jgi:hypothetical protein
VNISAGKYGNSDNMVVKIKDASGRVLDQTSISSGSWPNANVRSQCPGGKTQRYCHAWASAPLPRTPRLAAYQTYYLELSTSRGSDYRFHLIRDGSVTRQAGFNPNTTFSEGRAEVSNNGGRSWQGFTYWGYPDRAEGDLEFFFDAN